MGRLGDKAPVTRRTFLAGSVSTGLVMGLGSVLPGCTSEQAAEEMAAGGASRSFAPTIWFEMDSAGNVLVNITKAEMGQHVGTALARIVADELGAAWDAVSIKHVDSDPKWGFMVTGGSWSVWTSFAALSQAGAAGRTVLIDAAAEMMGVDAADCVARNGQVTAGSQSLTFGEIVAGGNIDRSFTAEELAAMPIKAAADRDLIGKPTAALDIPEKSTGTAQYGLDVELPNMVYAHPMIPPTRYGSVIRSIDDSAARDIPGYRRPCRLRTPVTPSRAGRWSSPIRSRRP